MVYFNEPFNADLFDVTSEYPIIEPEKMAQFPYFKEQSLADGEIRMTRIPTLRDFPMKAVSQSQSAQTYAHYEQPDGFQITITGAASPSTGTKIIGEVIIDYAYEFQPDENSLPICPVDVPLPGIQTNTVATNMFIQYPILQTLGSDQAKRVAQQIVSCAPPDYDSFLNCMD